MTGHREAPADVEPVRTELAEADRAAARSLPYPLEHGLEALPGRRAFEHEAKRAVAFARRNGHPLCAALIAFDVDVEADSDPWLRHATESWRDVLRTEDLIGRWSDDEFALILPNCTPASAVQLCWRLREKTPDGYPFCAGLVALSERDTVKELIARADVCLSQAQSKGPSRTVAEGLVDID